MRQLPRVVLRSGDADSGSRKAPVNPWVALVTALIAAGMWPAFAAVLESMPVTEVEQLLVAPEPVDDWSSLPESRWDWRPR